MSREVLAAAIFAFTYALVSGRRLLLYLTVFSAVFSAIFVNDTVCILVIPLLVTVIARAGMALLLLLTG